MQKISQYVTHLQERTRWSKSVLDATGIVNLFEEKKVIDELK
jgi:hypothetical protein